MKLALAILLLTLAGCSSLPQNTAIPRRLSNACLPNAQAMVEGLAKYQIPADVLLLTPADPAGMGHALAVYRHKGRIWAWDNTMGTVQILGAKWTDPHDMGMDWWHRWGKHYKAFRGKEYGTAWFLSAPEQFGGQ